MEFGWEVARVDRVGVGVGFEGGVSHVVADERDAVGNRTGANVSRRYGCARVSERTGESGSRADADLDESIEVREAHGEGASEGVHVGVFMIGEF